MKNSTVIATNRLGLGVRVLGEVKPHFVKKLQLADHIFIDELHKHDLYDETSQVFAVFLPVKSVGVKDDMLYTFYS